MQINTFFSLFVTLTGIILGSFYACSIVRYCSNSPLFTKRSKCPHCGEILKWYQLIPVVSFIIQRGSCSFCHEKISFFYPAVELLFGVLSLIAFIKFGFSLEFLFYLLAVHVILLASIIDYCLLIIPSLLSCYSFLIFLPAGYYLNIVSLSNIFSSFICFAALYCCHVYFFYVRKLEALGFGDIKFVLFLGLFLLPCEIPYFFMISSISALCYCIFLHLKYKTNLYTTKIPFGPFLGLAALIIIFL